ncbi:MAG: bifunctional 5,10-methylenetetrahydrofolate dehydrogenase/5,10-methenyltetrahydrofolate cyclohydrolase [Chloroflexota bacterium]|nr:bifunctional 5,10-methylenetetrahydrofolate dehydrogenase/5,10-methenyltetrahydrofolate cyclohydrolase [Chloroflexota bacterium]
MTSTQSPAQDVAESGARMLLGKPVAAAITEEVRAGVVAFVERYRYVPTLAVMTVGPTPAAERYTETLRKQSAAVGLAFERVALDPDSDEAAVRARIVELNHRPQIAGLLVQMPLPAHLPPTIVGETLDPYKDVDGITPVNAGNLSLGLTGLFPSTPLGGVALLAHYKIPLAGKHVVVVGRSNVVGRPLAQLFLREDATVTIAHSRTDDLADVTRRADILAVAVGRVGFITPEMVKPGVIVVDFGTTFTPDGLRGDVAPDVAAVASAFTPVPGGTGPVTNAILLRNTLRAARETMAVRSHLHLPD